MCYHNASLKYVGYEIISYNYILLLNLRSSSILLLLQPSALLLIHSIQFIVSQQLFCFVKTNKHLNSKTVLVLFISFSQHTSKSNYCIILNLTDYCFELPIPWGRVDNQTLRQTILLLYNIYHIILIRENKLIRKYFTWYTWGKKF